MKERSLGTKYNHYKFIITGPCKYWRENPQYHPEPKFQHYLKEAGVWCDTESVCEKCGWNPEVAQKRKRAIRERMRAMSLECPME